MSNKRFKCKIGWHKYKYIKAQRTKRMCFGLAGCEMPGQRVVRQCEDCGKIDYMRLTIFMPSRYLYEEGIWR